jgi:D-glycero-alpha-D-manno-heptose-7-phosphate kinase
MILSKTPLRMSFIGGGSDIPAFYNAEGMGAVISTSIDKHIFIAINKRNDKNIRLNYSQSEDVTNLKLVKHGLIRECLKVMHIESGIEIASLADIPSKGSGLGSSSAFTVGLLNALHAFKSLYIGKDMLAKIACAVEIDKCGALIGKQDQFSASFGGLNLIRFYDDESVIVDPIITSQKIKKDIENSILVFFTGMTRESSSVLRMQSSQLAIDKQLREVTKKMVQLAFEMKKIIEVGDLDNFGSILHEGWILKKQLNKRISNPDIDRLYEIGIRNGAIGGKLLGAGNGGYLMFYANQEHHEKISKALSDLRRVSFKFDNSGSQIVYYQPLEE